LTDADIHEVIPILRREVRQWSTPAVTIVSQREGNPFKVLISCILSLRTQDQTTGPASERLFALADTPGKMLCISQQVIEQAIYPVGFYRNKACQILEICRVLIDQHEGVVPDEIEGLLAFKGVGRKTANLVVTLGYGKPGICVDTHVHRISNRWGYLATRTPDETEAVLRKKLPAEYWLEINDLLVTYGQNLCRPISPYCSRCLVAKFCKRRGVTSSR
jgi:endonuclease-3